MPANDHRLPVKLTPDEMAAIKEAARRAGMSVHGWMRAILLAAAGASELVRQIKRVRPQSTDRT